MHAVVFSIFDSCDWGDEHQNPAASKSTGSTVGNHQGLISERAGVCFLSTGICFLISMLYYSIIVQN